MKIHYAIGDVHGRDDLLERMHDRITSYHLLNHQEKDGVIVHLGDYIDGGAKSNDVLNRVMKGVHGFNCVSLLGNHEALMMKCLETDDRNTWTNWLHNGGSETLNSLGVSFRYGGFDPAALSDALGSDRIAWLKSLRLYHTSGNFLFVHAGILPGVPLEKQKPNDLLWIRSRFLECDSDHGFVVVHGHTPTDTPILRHNRIGVDTGATSRGELTAVVLQDGCIPEFLQVEGQPGKGM